MPHVEIILKPAGRVRERDGDRTYDLIGWVCTTDGPPEPILIPDYVDLGEPLPLNAEAVLPRRVYVPEDM